MNRQPLLVEIRCEELPPAQVWALADSFPDALLEALKKAGFADEKSQRYGTPVARLATPRRFAALLDGICSHSPEIPIYRQGPAAAACRNQDGSPTPALVGFMHSVGASCENQLTEIEAKGKRYIAWQGIRPSQPLDDSLADIIEIVLQNTNAPRLMRWGANDFKFIRPIRGLLIMHGNKCLLPAKPIFGVTTTNTTTGHPVMSTGAIAVSTAAAYETALLNGKVIVNIDKRQQTIIEQFSSCRPTNDTLLAETAAICEYPIVYTGNIDDTFSILPAFCIEECIGKHQRAFLTKSTSTTYHFVADNRPQYPKALIQGFDAVVKARLNDICFYLNEDRKLGLPNTLEKLRTITYHGKLGNQYDRIFRIQTIAVNIAKRLGVSNDEITLLKNAAQICKSDLPTLMIGEYPALEGRIAAEYWGNNDAITQNLIICHNSRNWESLINDSPNPNTFGALLLANHLEKLVAMFGIGEIPSGSKDPHGLRYAALVVAEVQKKLHLPLSLTELIEIAQKSFDMLLANSTQDLRHFIIKRIYPRLAQEANSDVLNAVWGTEPEYIVDFENQVHALTEFKKLPDAAPLIEINKRIGNILRKSAAEITTNPLNPQLLVEKAEKRLLAAIQNTANNDTPLAQLKHLTSLKPVIDNFFNEVLVNDNNAKIRQNRLALLATLQVQLSKVGDLSKLLP